jgi:Cys-tRNA(Pro)/Cys-tRNA(Cys) deacylase
VVPVALENPSVKSALDVHRNLLATDVSHEMVRLPSSILTADDLPRALGVDAGSCVAVRCYTTVDADGRSGFAAVMVRAGDTPDPVSLLDALGVASVRPATAAETNAATDYAASLVSPLCLPAPVRLLADAALGGVDVLYTATGEGGVALGIRTRDLLVASGARVTTLTVQPLAAEGFDWESGAGSGRAEGRVVDLATGRRVRPRRTAG